MAIYHASTKPVSRGTGRSATAAAAYRSGESIHDERTGLTHDFTKKQGVEHTEIITPDDTKITREQLWNLAEKSEKRKDARTAREWEVALPDELNKDQRKELALGFGKELSKRYGVAVDVAIHQPSKDGDERNHHAHILMTTREFKNGELGAKAASELDNKQRKALGLESSQDEIKAVRELWANHSNKALDKAGYKERIDHRSHEDRGLETIPTKKMGKTATQLERRGVKTEKGQENDNISKLNKEITIKREKETPLKTTKNSDLSHDNNRGGTNAPAERENAQKGDLSAQAKAQAEKVLAQCANNPKMLEALYNKGKEVLGEYSQKLDERMRANIQKEVESRLKTMESQLKESQTKLTEHDKNKPMLLGRKEWEQSRQGLEHGISSYQKEIDTTSKTYGNKIYNEQYNEQRATAANEFKEKNPKAHLAAMVAKNIVGFIDKQREQERHQSHEMNKGKNQNRGMER